MHICYMPILLVIFVVGVGVGVPCQRPLMKSRDNPTTWVLVVSCVLFFSEFWMFKSILGWDVALVFSL